MPNGDLLGPGSGSRTWHHTPADITLQSVSVAKGFSASLTICCMFYTQIKSLNLELSFLLCLFSFLSFFISLHTSTTQIPGLECALAVPRCTNTPLSAEFVTGKGLKDSHFDLKLFFNINSFIPQNMSYFLPSEARIGCTLSHKYLLILVALCA